MGKNWDWPSFFAYMLLMVYFAFTLKKLCKKTVSIEKTDMNNQKKVRGLIILFSVFPIFFAVFRKVDTSIGLGGSDLINYLSFFSNKEFLLSYAQRGFALKTRNNPLFYYLLYIIRFISDDYHMMFLVIYTIIVISIYCFHKEFFRSLYSSAPLFFIFFFFLRSFSLLKFCLGLSLFYFSIISISKEKPFCAILWALLSLLIHSSFLLGFLCIVLYLVAQKGFFKKKSRLILFILVSYILIFMFGGYLKGFISESEMSSYLDLDLNWLTSNLTTILCGLLCLVFYKSILSLDIYNPFILYLVIFDVACIPVQTVLGFFRLHDIFTLPRLCAWGYIIEALKLKVSNKDKRLINIASYVLVIGWAVYRFIRTYESANLMPYIISF